MTPERSRRAVDALTERFGIPERRACALVGQHRSTQQRLLRGELRRLAEEGC